MTEHNFTYEDRRREKKIDREHLDDSPGHGAKTSEDELIDNSSMRNHSSDAATTFYDRDANNTVTRSDGSELTYKDLYHHHHGSDPMTSPDDSEQKEIEQFRESQILTIGSQIGLNKHLCYEAKKLMSLVDLDHFGSIKEEAVILGAVTLVCNRNDWWVQRDRKFLEMTENLGVSQDHIRQSRKIIKEQTSM